MNTEQLKQGYLTLTGKAPDGWKSNSHAWFDGSTAARAIPPTHVAGLCEQSGISDESTTEQYCAAIAAYCVGELREKHLWPILAAKHPIHPGCCLGHVGLVIDLEVAGLL